MAERIHSTSHPLATHIAYDAFVAATKKVHIAGNSSPKLAAQQQQQTIQSGSSGVHSWNSARQEEQPLPVRAYQSGSTKAVFVGGKQQATHVGLQPTNNNNSNSNNNNNSTTGRAGRNPALLLDQLTGLPSKQKPRNKNDEAIKDLLQRIPDIDRIFNVHSRIGNGTFSTVLLATLKKEGRMPEAARRKFAIKHHIPTSHPDRIMKELQCMTRMGGTDNVVGINCCLRCNSSAAFVMPYMPHDRFHDFYTKMDVDEIRLYMRNLLIALRHVHKFNIIHRDVKPSNFLYNRRQGQFLLVDFGLAQYVPSSSMEQNKAAAGRLAATAAATGSYKRPHDPDSLKIAGGDQVAIVEQPPTNVVVEGVKRPRLLEEGATKMPLKPINEKAQGTRSADALEVVSAKPNAAAEVQATLQTAAEGQAQPPVPANNNHKYNTSRNNGGGATTKCYCFANPSVCLSCLMKKEMHASRAGTPGYRPPEVLLKYADQTTAVDIWAAGVIFISILSQVYPFFKAPNDFMALAEIVTVFGDRAIRKTAATLDRTCTLSQRARPLNLRKVCLRFRYRSIFSDPEMVCKHETINGECQLCRNCDQYFFNCLCEDSVYAEEPLDPYECYPASAYDLLKRLLEVNPHNRITAEEALRHPFFTEVEKATTTTSNATRQPGVMSPRKRSTLNAAHQPAQSPPLSPRKRHTMAVAAQKMRPQSPGNTKANTRPITVVGVAPQRPVANKL
ncbi:cell division cycle 7-related protein kinase [Scaptodrosophila lebanonensis]|uniref:non-specific serine/threonine protein kinase n=1 Tax=Drosophila lebanonensis TaxID=7225 RepID=A0A6J2UDM5_DROLE|nr:cell division cycle 7-related protein kinase [Scaptodrosophila lebanonensis]XP_030386470.1 cell division cycle 7-related protein kinase [Scaptodrosophila lebanonensis]